MPYPAPADQPATARVPAKEAKLKVKVNAVAMALVEVLDAEDLQASDRGGQRDATDQAQCRLHIEGKSFRLCVHTLGFNPADVQPTCPY